MVLLATVSHSLTCLIELMEQHQTLHQCLFPCGWLFLGAVRYQITMRSKVIELSLEASLGITWIAILGGCHNSVLVQMPKYPNIWNGQISSKPIPNAQTCIFV